MTDRQRQLLAAIIREFIATANAVGSVKLNEANKFNISSATIRNEMAALAREGLLEKTHSSAGRIPTEKGIRLFIQELLEDLEEVDMVTQTQAKQQLHQARFDRADLMRKGLRVLNQLSSNVAVGLVDSNIYYSGLSDLLNVPEFEEKENLQKIMYILEDYSSLFAMLERKDSHGEVRVLVGEEDTGNELFQNYAVVYAELKLHRGQKGFVAVVGPHRMDYTKIIPAVKFVAESINAVVSGWE